ncbi:MAG: hydroxypyruvate isomerase [Smithellaceae bacterium]|nr:hydroxypyruvate isomerase [Smithellaceae bacterium]
MPKFCANLTMLFNEASFLDRFERAARAGFSGVEYLFPYEWEADILRDTLQKYNLVQVLHNLPAGDWAKGERGIACLPGREGEFQAGVGRAIQYAKTLGCRQLNCLVGLTPPGESPEKTRERLIENLRFAAAALEKEGIRFLVEPLNIVDVPGFNLTGTAATLRLFEEIGHRNLWLQYDVYHMQITEGNLIRTMRDNLGRIAHIQIADNPGRNEPGTGEINFTNLFKALDEAGYQGWIGCEYKPLGDTAEGLAWLKPYLTTR